MVHGDRAPGLWGCHASAPPELHSQSKGSADRLPLGKSFGSTLAPPTLGSAPQVLGLQVWGTRRTMRLFLPPNFLYWSTYMKYICSLRGGGSWVEDRFMVWRQRGTKEWKRTQFHVHVGKPTAIIAGRYVRTGLHRTTTGIHRNIWFRGKQIRYLTISDVIISREQLKHAVSRSQALFGPCHLL